VARGPFLDRSRDGSVILSRAVACKAEVFQAESLDTLRYDGEFPN
jgi:hypothetical protein